MVGVKDCLRESCRRGASEIHPIGSGWRLVDAIVGSALWITAKDGHAKTAAGPKTCFFRVAIVGLKSAKLPRMITIIRLAPVG